MKILTFSGLLILLILAAGCRTNHMLEADPNKSDILPEQARNLSKKRLHVPCRVEVHCPDSLVGEKSGFSSIFSSHYFYYPLQEILKSSFKSAAFSVFDQPGGEIIDAFNLYVTVPESNLNISSESAEYLLQVIVSFNEPGEKKITAWSIHKHLELPYQDQEKVPDAIYQATREVAFEVMKKLTENPKVLRTVRRFEDK